MKRDPVSASISRATTQSGLVLASYRRHYAVELDGGEVLECVLRGRSLVLACGDRVQVTRQHGGGIIEAVDARTTLFYRSDGHQEKSIAANVTQVIGVVAPDVGVDEELINRWIVGAETQHCRFLLAANKDDQPDFPRLLSRVAPFAALGYPVIALSAKKSAAPLESWVSGERTVLIGQSGMGKSTIINQLAPAAAARTGDVSAALGAGRHTTSHSTLYRLPAALDGGWMVDSPGMKLFGLAHVPPEALAEAFVELRSHLGECRFRDCRHDREPGCALREAVACGQVAAHRLALLRALVRDSEAARRSG